MDEKDKTIKENLPKDFSILEEAGKFWNTHSTAGYKENFEPVYVETVLPLRISSPGTAVTYARRRE